MLSASPSGDPGAGGRRVLLYFAWSHPEEAHAPLPEIDDRFPALFELRRLFYPRFEALAQPPVDQGISGFLEHVQKANFAGFAEQVHALTGHPLAQAERVSREGNGTSLAQALAQPGDTPVDTLVIISFDSVRTRQRASEVEIAALKRFLECEDHLAIVCLHHDIGEVDALDPALRAARQLQEHLHHGDAAIPPRQAFGQFGLSLLAGLGLPVENRYGLRPAAERDGSPTPIDIDRTRDALSLLHGVNTFNLHPHLPHLARLGEGLARLDVLARQWIDPAAPPHPFTEAGHQLFDALLQSNAAAYPGKVLVCDATLFSATAGGLDSLRQFWSNIVLRPGRG